MTADKINRLILSALLMVGLGLAAGCGTATVIPEQVAPVEHVAYDPIDTTEPTNGILEWNKAEGYAIITATARDRYNGFITKYGASFTPRIKKDYGLTKTATPGRYRINNAALDKWLIMAAWHRQGRK